MKKSNVKLSDKEKLLDNFKMLEERRTKYIERQILNQVYKEINDLLELKQIADDAIKNIKNGGNHDAAM